MGIIPSSELSANRAKAAQGNDNFPEEQTSGCVTFIVTIETKRGKKLDLRLPANLWIRDGQYPTSYKYLTDPRCLEAAKAFWDRCRKLADENKRVRLDVPVTLEVTPRKRQQEAAPTAPASTPKVKPPISTIVVLAPDDNIPPAMAACIRGILKHIRDKKLRYKIAFLKQQSYLKNVLLDISRRDNTCDFHYMASIDKANIVAAIACGDPTGFDDVSRKLYEDLKDKTFSGKPAYSHYVPARSRKAGEATTYLIADKGCEPESVKEYGSYVVANFDHKDLNAVDRGYLGSKGRYDDIHAFTKEGSEMHKKLVKEGISFTLHTPDGKTLSLGEAAAPPVVIEDGAEPKAPAPQASVYLVATKGHEPAEVTQFGANLAANFKHKDVATVTRGYKNHLAKYDVVHAFTDRGSALHKELMRQNINFILHTPDGDGGPDGPGGGLDAPEDSEPSAPAPAPTEVNKPFTGPVGPNPFLNKVPSGTRAVKAVESFLVKAPADAKLGPGKESGRIFLPAECASAAYEILRKPAQGKPKARSSFKLCLFADNVGSLPILEEIFKDVGVPTEDNLQVVHSGHAADVLDKCAFPAPAVVVEEDDAVILSPFGSVDSVEDDDDNVEIYDLD